MRRDWLVDLWHSLSTIGLLLGTLFFAASLTPTLVPRTSLTQGVLSGWCLAAGYGIGVFGDWLLTYVGLPKLEGRARRLAKLAQASFVPLSSLLSSGVRLNGKIRSAR
jgi:uncharacterized membrane protein